jgi:hypothetical protein
MGDADRTRRRRRRKPATAAARPDSGAQPTGDAPPAPAAATRRRRSDAPVERGLRDLVGAGHSQLGVDGALRGRDVDRPTEEDLAEAEREVVIVRRHWQPPG